MKYVVGVLLPFLFSAPPLGRADCCGSNANCCVVCPDCPPSCCGG